MYIKKDVLEVGDVVVNTKPLESLSGTFEKGTLLKITGYNGYRGFSVKDEIGNRMSECSFDFKKVDVPYVFRTDYFMSTQLTNEMQEKLIGILISFYIYIKQKIKML